MADKAKLGTSCIFCGKSMRRQTKPQWIFDLEKAELKGLAHTTCTLNEALHWYSSKRAKWEEKAPTKEQIVFGCKIVAVLDSLRGHGGESDEFYVLILLSNCVWVTSSIDECLGMDRVKELLDWWVNGSKIMGLQRAERIRKLLIQKMEA